MLSKLNLFLEHYTDSLHLDSQLGFRVEEIERGLLQRARECRPQGDMNSWGSVLHDGNQTWVGLAPATLQTPYPEIKRMCEILSPSPGQRVVDLGAGYGRMGLVLDLFYPGVQFLGLEFVKERVEEGSRVLQELGCHSTKLLIQDLTDPSFQMPEAEHYFIYDYGKVHHIRETLKQLDEMANHRSFKVVARGKGTRSIIEREHPWLCDVHPPHHEENFSVYFMES